MTPVAVKMSSQSTASAAANAMNNVVIPNLTTSSAQTASSSSSSSASSSQNSNPSSSKPSTIIHEPIIVDSDEENNKTHNINHNSHSVIPPPGFSCEKVSLSCNCKKVQELNENDQNSSSIHNILPESLPEPCEDLDSDKHSLAARSFAGGIAGLVEHLAIYPFDTIKTNSQTGLRNQLRIKTGLDYIKWYKCAPAWSGVSALVPACTLAHALQFPCIEITEKALQNRFTNINSSFWAGVVGILPHDLVMNPANVVKQRMQQISNTNRSSWGVAKELYKAQGPWVFYRSLPAQYSVGAVFMGTFYYCYNDILKNKMKDNIEKQKLERHWFLAWLFRNTLATICAVIATQPLDTIVTRVNTGYGENGKTTIRSSVRGLMKEGFMRAAFTGTGARLSCSIPASILTWGTYEAIKYTLRDEK